MNSVCLWCPLGNLLDISGEDLIHLILTPRGEEEVIFDLKETVYDHIHTLPDLPVTRNLVCIFSAPPDTEFFLCGAIPSRKRWPGQGRVVGCTMLLRVSLLPSSIQLQTSIFTCIYQSCRSQSENLLVWWVIVHVRSFYVYLPGTKSTAFLNASPE